MSAAVQRSLAAHNEGVRRARAGDPRGAIASLREAVAIAGADAADPRTLKALAKVALAEQDWGTGLAAALGAATRDPGDHVFVQQAVDALASCPLSALPAVPACELPARLPSLTIVVVSQDDARFAAASAEFARAFRDWPHQLVRVKGARSMYEGYARGFSQSSGEFVVFSHDDVRLAAGDFAARLARALSDADVVGAAGTTRLAGPALNWAGHPHLFGSVVHRDAASDAYELWALSLAGPVVPGAQALDGVFIAARREWAARVGFDERGIPGFHFYDLDFSYRAHLAGARVAIACDLGLVHLSQGNFDTRWKAAQAAFARKHGLPLEAPPAPRHFYGARLPDLAAVDALYRKLSAARTLALA